MKIMKHDWNKESSKAITQRLKVENNKHQRSQKISHFYWWTHNPQVAKEISMITPLGGDCWKRKSDDHKCNQREISMIVP